MQIRLLLIIAAVGAPLPKDAYVIKLFEPVFITAARGQPARAVQELNFREPPAVTGRLRHGFPY